MSSSNIQPDALSMPFANNGDKSTIPSSATGTNKASLTEGFPQITSESIADGGIPPSREDFNALGNISTSHNYFMQNGGGYTFVPAVSTAIGGYPKGALLWYYPSSGNPQLLVSTKNNNTDNFNTNQSYIGTEGSGNSWEIVTVSGANYVDLTSNQTIGGVKTHTDNVIISKEAPILYARNTRITRNTAPTSNQNIVTICGQDSVGQSTWGIYHRYYTTKETNVNLICYKGTTTDNSYTYIGVGYDSSGNPYTYAPTPATSDNSTKIATTAYVQSNLSSYALDSNVVHKTGNETIGGVKTLTSILELTSSYPAIRENNTSLTVGTAPSSNSNLSMIVARDSNEKFISNILSHYNTNKDVHTRIYAYKSNASTDTADTYLRVYYTADGHYGVSITGEGVGSDTNDSLVNSTTSTTNTTVPCMGWVNSRLADTKGNVTINGATNLTSSISLGSRYTFGASGLLVLTIRVTGQTGPTVEVRMSDTNNASSSSQIVTIFSENGGSSEYFQGPLTFPIKKGNSIYLNKTGTGSATVERAYLFAWNNS